jgi:hypothetical protein
VKQMLLARDHLVCFAWECGDGHMAVSIVAVDDERDVPVDVV